MSSWDRPPREGKESVKVENEATKIHWRIDQWFADLSTDQKSLLKTYHSELQRFSKTINLVSPKTIPHADGLHFADCILGSRIIYNSTKIDEIYDLGSGNGFPGAIFAILYPAVMVKLIDSDERKCEFLKHISSTLKLKNVEVINKNIESLPAGSIKFAVSRGYASIAKSILVCRKLFSTGGKFYHFKGDEWASEVAAIPTQLCSFWTPSLVGEYKLPVGDFRFAVVKTDKIAD